MSQFYKESRICECGYTTNRRDAWSTHKKRCKLVVTSEKEVIATLKQQLAEKDELLHEKREEIRMFEKLLAERFTELQDEVKQLRKRKKTTRIYRSEPERRKIAERQNWKCGGETCMLAGKLEAYDLDHIIPLSEGGEDTDDNLQALCPACHRKKTDRERMERVELHLRN